MIRTMIQSRFRGDGAVCCLGLAAFVWVMAAAVPAWASVDDETLRAFLKHVEESPSFAAEGKRFVAKMWADRDAEDSQEMFIVEALAVLSEPFRNGLDAYDDEEYVKALESLTALGSDPDPYLSANASVMAIKALVELERLEEALERVTALGESPMDLYTTMAPELAYLKGYLELRVLEYEKAAASLQALLAEFPEGAQRLRVSAKQMLAELARREPEKLGDVSDLMSYAARRLDHSETGDPVQERQRRAVELLEKLIEEAEQNEQSGGGGSGSGSGSGQKAPQSPMQDSTLPSGGGPPTSLRSARKIQPGEVWGSMPPAERERILQTLRDSFPSRYRQLVEQYYEELAKQP